jgi:hypothetical protein
MQTGTDAGSKSCCWNCGVSVAEFSSAGSCECEKGSIRLSELSKWDKSSSGDLTMKIANGHSSSRTQENLAEQSTSDFEPLLDCQEAAQRVHCHEKTLQRYARQRRIPAYRIHGR